MRVLMIISDNTFPPDIRVEKEIKTLKDHGNTVGVIAIRKKGEKQRDNLDGVEIWRITIPMRTVPKIGRMMELSLLRHLKRRDISRIVREFKPDIIHVHDLPLATPAMKIALKEGIPIIVDFHEHYPAMIFDRLPRTIARLIAPILYREERWLVSHADAIITVVDENTERIKKAYGVDNVFTVENAADLDVLDAIKNRHKVSKKTHDICYVGGLNHARGLETFIRALAKVEGDVTAIVIGDGPLRDDLENLASELGVSVEFTGHLPFERAMEYVLSSHMGIVPHDSTLHTEHTVPHKLFQYMALGLPVIVSDVRPLKRIVEECNCGFVFHASDAEDCARTIDMALSTMDSDEWSSIVERARRCAEEKHSWKVAGRKLMEVYAMVMDKYGLR